MAIRDLGELGPNLRKIMKRLMANDDLVKLLYYTDADPLSHNALTEEQKRSLVYDKLIKIVPVVSTKEVDNSVIVIRVSRGVETPTNNQFQNITLNIESFVPFTQWIIKDENLRPFKIMGEIQKSLSDKTINGLGKLGGGNFELSTLTGEVSIYDQQFSITDYN